MPPLLSLLLSFPWPPGWRLQSFTASSAEDGNNHATCARSLSSGRGKAMGEEQEPCPCTWESPGAPEPQSQPEATPGARAWERGPMLQEKGPNLTGLPATDLCLLLPQAHPRRSFDLEV
ncbi:hypothetical protein P7K49_011804 [Saguinus oedipus]|uniref:Uncharacterized protein n=1 Tax=Saguinus oedipus TaxID=9490 RepID=A0ABQ9VV97_SAGOE|nr:hypothetical protein P7K49_011804 [Saguinus oedipus]